MSQVPGTLWVWICSLGHRFRTPATTKAYFNGAFRCEHCVGPVRYVLPKEHSKRYQAEHRKQGLCICCPRKATRGLRCMRCANKHAAQERSRRARS